MPADREPDLRAGDSVDESFFATIETELTEHMVYAAHDAAIASIADSIECFYNPQRGHSRVGVVDTLWASGRSAAEPTNNRHCRVETW